MKTEEADRLFREWWGSDEQGDPSGPAEAARQTFFAALAIGEKVGKVAAYRDAAETLDKHAMQNCTLALDSRDSDKAFRHSERSYTAEIMSNAMKAMADALEQGE